MKTKMGQKHLQHFLASEAFSQFFGFFILWGHLHCTQGFLLLILLTPFSCFPGLDPPWVMVISLNVLASFTTLVFKSCLVQGTVHPTLYYTAPPRRPIQQSQTHNPILPDSFSRFLSYKEARTLGITSRVLFLMSLSQSVPNSVSASCLGSFVLGSPFHRRWQALTTSGLPACRYSPSPCVFPFFIPFLLSHPSIRY